MPYWAAKLLDAAEVRIPPDMAQIGGWIRAVVARAQAVRPEQGADSKSPLARPPGGSGLLDPLESPSSEPPPTLDITEILDSPPPLDRWGGWDPSIFHRLLLEGSPQADRCVPEAGPVLFIFGFPNFPELTQDMCMRWLAVNSCSCQK